MKIELRYSGTNSDIVVSEEMFGIAEGKQLHSGKVGVGRIASVTVLGIDHIFVIADRLEEAPAETPAPAQEGD